ncbi:hypothetical protein, partial [Endozoicomonas sp. ONNA2]|uniref:hypothetical protein n=1 Tax=Endozoicomonas sp. ONNA2 TaxID=2828741 RepID=UPI00214728B8
MPHQICTETGITNKKLTAYMFTIRPGASGYGQNNHSQASDHCAGIAQTAGIAQKRRANSADDPAQPSKIPKKTPEIEVLSVKIEQLHFG